MTPENPANQSDRTDSSAPASEAGTVASNLWLRPSLNALLNLVEEAPDLDALRSDPGFLIHFLRFARPTPTPETFELTATNVLQAGLCEAAATLLERDPGEIEFSEESLKSARLKAEELARDSGTVSADTAFTVALLRELIPASIARKYFPRWRLPQWLTVAIGYSELPRAEQIELGGDERLVELFRDSVPGPTTQAESDDPYRVENQSGLKGRYHSAQVEGLGLLPRLLKATAKLRARSAPLLVLELEERIEKLSQQLIRAKRETAEELNDSKLTALAEFAAGAAHEINNPLAVIATNVQLLRSHEEDEERLDRYDAVLRQTKRIHDILHGTRQFARPPVANPALLAISTWAAPILKDAEAEAIELNINFEGPNPSTTGRIWADAAMVRTLVGHLLQNAFEAAGSGGWVRMRFESDGNQSEISVEDSGPGPSPEARSHLFDPFYSGRSAGRGRGLGLSIAWQLAKQNKGRVEFRPSPNGPTRFVVTLPAQPPVIATRSKSKSA